MPSLALRLEVETTTADALSDALLDAGAQSVSIEAPDGPRAVLSALFSEASDPARALAQALEQCGQSPQLSYTVQPVPDADWIRASQAQFTPLELGNLWVGATWHTAPTRPRHVVRIDPGLAFGTGSHPTTRLMLRFLQGTLRGGERVLDFGCGSGILAIAAAKLGASHVDAVDIDPQAVIVTRDNARANQVVVNAALPEDLAAGRYDVLVANILAQPLIELATVLSTYAGEGARLALAGILESQADEVASAYSSYFSMSIVERDEGWALLAGVRK